MQLADADFRGTKRFELVRRVGAGGMGVVYEALDREHGSHVALKTLRSFDASTILLFKREFRALEGLHHPNLVQLRDLVEERGRWFFTMELVRGVDFMSHVRPLGCKTPDEPTSVAMARVRARLAASMDGPPSSSREPLGPSTKSACATRSPSWRAASSPCMPPTRCIATSSRRTCW